MEYTEILPSPPLYRKWVAIFFLAAAMERKIWVRTMGSALYPNLYVLLVGPPGIGKGQAIYLGEGLLREVPDLVVGPSDMTSASLIDALNEAVRRVLMKGDPPYLEFNSLTVVSRELGVLIPGWETSLMNNLTDIYDGFTVDQKRRGKDVRIKILAPQINLLGACTPGYLSQVIPAGAWDQGFLSRTILVYSGDRRQTDPFAEEALAELTGRQRNDLLHDLKSVSAEIGQMSFSKAAVIAIKEWMKAGCPPEPSHQKLQNYNSRRLAHVLKLCMTASMAVTSDKIITLEHFRTALGWLIEAENYMPDIFKSMVTGGDSNAMEEAWNFTWVLFAKEKKPISEHRIVHFLRERVPAHSVMQVLQVMVKSKMLEINISGNNFNGYTPRSKAERMEGS